MENIVAIAALLAMLGVAVGYIVGEKRKGHKCIGCPYAKECARRNNGAGCGN